ncbi:MAG: hypothetical protein U9M97_02785, partial [Candidatus Hadarchaeota archaeon]|nr:hypothetical protein [Candidatus Hadarchaeota archaeon]
VYFMKDEKIKADVMNRLLRRKCWGARYIPLSTLVNWLGKKIKKSGRRVRNSIDQLVKEGYLISHKRGATISLNPARSEEIVEYINRILKI